MASAGVQSDAVTAALDAAATLEAGGRVREAIDALTRANRAQPSERLERELVALRHRGFARLEGGPVPATPPIVAEEAPGAGLPAVDPADLDADVVRDGLARHGCVLVRGLVDRARAAELAEGIDAALAAFDAAVAGAPVEETSPWYAPFEPTAGSYRVGGRRTWMRASGGMWTADSPRMLFELLELVDSTGIGDLVAEHLGERPALSANKCNLRRVPIDTNTAWHQDGSFLGAGTRTLNLWLGLDHCGADAPGLDLVPRRIDEVLPTGTEGALFDWSVSPEVVAEAAGDTGVLRPVLEPGDALLFDHLFLHATAVDAAMTRPRHAIETWFFAPSTYPDGQIPLVY